MSKKSKIAILVVAVIVITATLITTVLLVRQQQDIRREASQTYTCCSGDPEGSPTCGPVTCTYPDGPCACLPVEDCDGNTTNGMDRWCTYTAPPGPGAGFDLYKDGNNIKANNPTNETETIVTACFICAGPANDGCSDSSPDFLRSCGGGTVTVAPGASAQQIIGAPEFIGPCENYQADAHVQSTPPEDSDALVGQSDLQGEDCLPTDTPTATPTQPTGTSSPTPTEHKPSPTPTGVTTTPTSTPTGTLTPTATPTTPVGGPSATITPTPTGTNAPTSTDTPSGSSSPTPTPVTSLPDSGLSVPTILTAVLGGALLMFSLLFAL